MKIDSVQVESARDSSGRYANVNSPKGSIGGRCADSLLTINWEPEARTIEALVVLGIPISVIESRVASFRNYYLYSQIREISWDARFVYHVSRQWKKSLDCRKAD